MWGDMSLWNVQGPLLDSGDHIVPHILTVDYTFNIFFFYIFVFYLRSVGYIASSNQTYKIDKIENSDPKEQLPFLCLSRTGSGNFNTDYNASPEPCPG